MIRGRHQTMTNNQVTLSQLIKHLQGQLEEHGDVPVYWRDEYYIPHELDNFEYTIAHDNQGQS